MNGAPYEVVAAPFTLFWAPVGTAFPDLHEAPAAAWVKIGSSGDLNYDRGAGVTVEHRQATTPWRSVGDTGVRKNFRTEEDCIVRMTVVDLTLEQYRVALNNNTVSDVVGEGGAGAPPHKRIGLSRGPDIATVALLVRGDVSPYQEDGVCQYQIPMAQQIGSPTVALSIPGQPAGLALEFMALVDTTAASEDERFGVLLAQDDTVGT